MRRQILCLFLATAAALTTSAAEAVAKRIVNLRTCYQTTPLALEQNPTFSWRMLADDAYGASQKAYRIVLSDSKENLSKGVYVYDSGKQTSDISVCVPYRGTALKPATRYYWKVSVWDEKNREISSDATWFETAMKSGDWEGAQWIGSQKAAISRYNSYALFQVDFQLDKPCKEGTFVFCQKDKDNYAFVSLDGSGKSGARLKFGHCYKGKKTDNFDLDVSQIVTAQGLNSRHVLDVDLRSDQYFRQFIVKLKLDGRGLKNEKGKKPSDNFVIDPDPKNESYHDVRLYNIGYSLPAGATAAVNRLRISDQRHGALLTDRTDLGTLKGDGTIHSEPVDNHRSAPMLRKEFSIGKTVKQARLYATARGIYEMTINGRRVTESFFNPGWPDYHRRFTYNTFDVTPLLKQGQNAWGAVVGHGWFTGNMGYNSFWANEYGNDNSILAKLVVQFEDGSKETIVTDGSWTCYDEGPVVTNNFLDGEDYDARKEVPGWDLAGFKGAGWSAVKIYPALAEGIKMQSYIGNTVNVDTVCTALKMTEPLPGHYIYDMGQNVAGVPQIALQGREGQTVTLHFAEMLYPEVIPTDPVAPYTIEMYQAKKGQMYLDNYRGARSTDTYICKGGAETILPRFTSHGFRYVEITGLDAPLPLEDVKVLVLNSLGKKTANYHTSDSLINKLYSNIVWGQRDNFMVVPTDCPQRDERLGWSGDAQIFTRTSTYNRDVASFFKRWLYTVRDEQGSNGNFANYNPVIGTNHAPGTGHFGWSEVGIISPWQIYQQYGDVSVLEESYASMVRYMDYVEKRAKDGIIPLGGYGDWVALLGTPSDLTNTCYAAYDAQIMTKVARILGKTDDAQRFSALFDKFKEAFKRRFVRGDHLIIPAGSPAGRDSNSAAFGGGGTMKEDMELDTQTGYIMPLYVGILDEDFRPKAVGHLLDLLKKNNYCINTGFIGTPYLNLVLSEFGHDDVAYRMFQQQAYPSWLYPVLQGATTIWERWNSYTLKNGFGPVSMNSFNHYSYGAVQDWMMSYSAGIERDEAQPGYKHIVLQPRVGGNFDFIEADFESVYGLIESRWQSDRQKGESRDAAAFGYTYEATVPANTTATLTLPLTQGRKVTVVEGKKGLKTKKDAQGRTQYELKSGKYKFTVR